MIVTSDKKQLCGRNDTAVLHDAVTFFSRVSGIKKMGDAIVAFSFS